MANGKYSKAKMLPQAAKKDLALVGEQIKLARCRRKISLRELSERAGCSQGTLIKVEKGDPTVAIGIYVRVLFGLGLHDDILAIARDDVTGRALQDIRDSRSRKTEKEEYYDFD